MHPAAKINAKYNPQDGRWLVSFVNLGIAWSQKRPTKENKYQTALLVVSQLCNQRSPYEVLADSKSSIRAKTLCIDEAAHLNVKYQRGKSAQMTNPVDL